MTTTQFCHWFHGFLTLENPEFISAAQTQIIKDHLAPVFNKVTPDRSGPLNYGDNFRGVITNLDQINTKSSNFESPASEDKKPDYFIGYPNPIPMFDQYGENGKPKPRSIC